MGALLGLMPSIFKLGGKLIQDADKRAEYAFKCQEMMNNFMMKMLDTKTYPWVDGLVKLAYASEAIIKGLFRPVVASGLFVWGLMNPEVLVKLQAMEGMGGDIATTAVFGSFPAWLADRGIEKARKVNKPNPMEEDPRGWD